MICATLSRAATWTGVVYSIETGNGANPSGSIDLAVGQTIHPMIWPPQIIDRRMPGCTEIGAIWTVETDGGPALPMISRVTCRGVNKPIRGAWMLVRAFAEGYPAISALSTLSSRYRSSLDFQRFSEHSFDWSMISHFIRMVRLDPSGRARLDLYGSLDVEGRPGKPAVFSFELVRNKRTARWEIDGISVT